MEAWWFMSIYMPLISERATILPQKKNSRKIKEEQI